MKNLYDETKYIMKKYNIHANKNLGQNFLIDELIVDTIIQKADISKEDLIIEIGPGLGTLTEAILQKAGKVVCIELDEKMICILKDRFFMYSNFDIINEDVLKVNLKELIKKEKKNESIRKSSIEDFKEDFLVTDDKSQGEVPYVIKNIKVVANLPYYITTPIIMKLLEDKLDIKSITVMVQKEVADRLTAIPGDKLAGAITYSVYYYAQVQKLLDVPHSSFIPEPDVESQVIQLSIRKQPPIEITDEDILFKIIKLAFMQRRKTLVNALSSGGIFKNKEEIYKILKELNINKKVRGEALTLEQFAQIANYIDATAQTY